MKHNYEVKAVKSFRGREGYGFNANLYHNGKKVCFVMDSGNGGCYRYEWTNRDVERVSIKHPDSGYDYKVTPEEKILKDHVEALPEFECYGGMMKHDSDTFISNLIDSYEYKKKLKSRCRTKTLFTLPDCGENECYTIKAKFCEKIKTFIMSKHPEAVILNETI